MAEKIPTRKRPNRRAIAGLSLTAILLVLGWYVNSHGFRERVRLAVIAKLQQVTGGEVELKSLNWNLSRLEVEGSDLTVHGFEGRAEIPYLHADHFVLRLKILSVFGGKVGLRYLSVERPQVRIVVDVAGKSTEPPTISGSEPSAPIRNLLNLGADRVELSHGELILNDRRIPLEVTADDVAATVKRQGTNRVEGSLSVGKIDTQLEQLRPFASSAHAEFFADHGEWVVTSLRLQSGASQFNASARMTDPRNLTLETRYELALDLPQAAAIFRSRAVKAGTLDIVGAAVISPQSVSANGNLRLTNAAWQTSSVRASGINTRAAFTIRDDDLALTQLSGNWQSAAFAGNFAVHGWAPRFLTLIKHRKEASGSGEIRLSGLRIEQGANALFGDSFQGARIHLAGTAAGNAEISWTGTFKNLRTKVVANIAAPPQPLANELPIHGSIAATGLWPSRLEVDHLQLDTAMSTFRAAGTMGATSSNLSVNINSSQIAEIAQIIAAMRRSALPMNLHGSGTFAGTLAGRLAAPAIAGHFELSNVDLGLKQSALLQQKPFSSWLQLVGGNLSQAQDAHWDNFRGDVQLSSGLISFQNAALTRGAARADFSGRATLANYGLQPDSAVTATFNVRDASILDLEHFVGSSYRASGSTSLHVTVSGPLTNPRGEGSASIVQGSVGGQEFRAMSANLNFADQQAQFTNFKMTLAQAQLMGEGAYNWSTQAFRVSLDGSDFNLSRVRWLQRPKFSAQGEGTLHLDGAGTVAEPRINANLNLRKLVLNGEPTGDVTAQAVTQGANLHVSMQSNFVRAKILGSGSVYLRGDWPTQFSINFSRLDVDPLLTALVAGRITEHSALDGSLYVRGPLKKPRELEVEGALQNARINVENLALQSAGPVRFSFKQQTLILDALHIVGEDTDFAASGRIPLQGSSSAALNASGQVNLRILSSFIPSLAASGTTSMSVHVAGSMTEPIITGKLQIEHAGVSPSESPAGLSDVNGSMVFNENRLTIETLTAHTGGGEFNVGGFISYTHGIYFDFTAQGSQIRLRYPPGVSSVADANLRFAGTFASSLLSGDITVTRFGLNPEFDFASYLASSQGPPALTPAQSILNNIHLDVNVVTTPELQVQMSLGRIAGNADLRLRGTAAKPAVLGRVNILEGRVFFSGTNYRIDRGDITFSNPVVITPVLDLEASAKVRDYDITLGLHGPMHKMSVTYRSEPPLPTPDIIALIALGHTHQDEVLNTQPQTQTFADSNALLGQALNASVSSRVQQLFGVSRIKIDPQAGGPENNPNTRLTLEQQVSNRVILTYLTNLSQAAQQEVQVEVELSRNLSAVGLRDQNGVLSFTLRMRQRKR